MAEQMALGLAGSDLIVPVDWRRLDRRARRRVEALVGESGARAGFALRRYAEAAALLEVLRGELAGRRVKRGFRGSGRMRVKASVLFAASRSGRKLHAVVDRLEERVSKQEAAILCG